MSSFSIFGREFNISEMASQLKGTGREAQRQITSNFHDFERTLSLNPIHNVESSEPSYPLYPSGRGLPIIGTIGVFMIEHMGYKGLEKPIKGLNDIKVMEI